MATRFRLYSTDVDPTTNPDVYGQETPPSEPSAPPATLIKWDNDPIHSGGLNIAPPQRRASAIRTQGGVVHHDFGVIYGDGTLSISGNTDEGEWLSKDTIDELKIAYAAIDTDFYFTDGIDVWKVRFQSFNFWRSQLWVEAGFDHYSYELVFWNLGQEDLEP